MVWCDVSMISVPALVVAEAADADAAIAEKQPNDCVERRHPAEVGRIEPAKRRTLSNGKHTASYIRSESAEGFSHSGLSSTDEVLCASGRAWTHRVREDDSLHGSEVKLPIPPSTPRCWGDDGGGHRFWF